MTRTEPRVPCCALCSMPLAGRPIRLRRHGFEHTTLSGCQAAQAAWNADWCAGVR